MAVKKKRSGLRGLLPKSGKSKSEKLSVFEKQKKLFRDVLHKAGKKKSAQISCTKEINVILDQLDEDDREAVILEKFQYKIDKVTLDVDGIQFSLRLGLYKILKVLLNKVRVVPYLQSHQLLEHAIMSKDDMQLIHIIQKYEYESVQIVLTSISDRALSTLYEESWKQETIEALYPYTSSYLIPRQQNKTKMYAFVCYNTFDVETSTGQKTRYGAKEEADRIIKGFQNCGITVRGPLIDWTFDELLQHLKNLTSEVKNDCSVVFMCIMTHGDQGVIYDKESKVGEINKILNITYLLKDFLPVVRSLTLKSMGPFQSIKILPCILKVVLIQACQGLREPKQHISINYKSSMPDSPDSDAGLHGQPPGNSTWDVVPYMHGIHISVLRPNTIVITATAEYHKATRKIFLSHFASQMERSDGVKTINSMVQLCSKTMSLDTDVDSRRQAPLSYDLLRQPLILPLAAAYDRMKLTPHHHHSGTIETIRRRVGLVNDFRKLYAGQVKDRLKGRKSK